MGNEDEITRGLRRDVDELKCTTVKMQEPIIDLKEVSSARAMELSGLTKLVAKVENTMSDLVSKVDKLSLTVVSLNFCSTEEVDKKLRENSIDLDKKIEEATSGLKHEVNQMKGDVENLKAKPGKKLDAIELIIISSIVSGIIGFVIGKF